MIRHTTGAIDLFPSDKAQKVSTSLESESPLLSNKNWIEILINNVAGSSVIKTLFKCSGNFFGRKGYPRRIRGCFRSHHNP
jgi:hypothetical protein